MPWVIGKSNNTLEQNQRQVLAVCATFYAEPDRLTRIHVAIANILV
jgi:hypothetical protein